MPAPELNPLMREIQKPVASSQFLVAADPEYIARIN
jgi:hypothetical protein